MKMESTPAKSEVSGCDCERPEEPSNEQEDLLKMRSNELHLLYRLAVAFWFLVCSATPSVSRIFFCVSLVQIGMGVQYFCRVVLLCFQFGWGSPGSSRRIV